MKGKGGSDVLKGKACSDTRWSKSIVMIFFFTTNTTKSFRFALNEQNNFLILSEQSTRVSFPVRAITSLHIALCVELLLSLLL